MDRPHGGPGAGRALLICEASDSAAGRAPLRKIARLPAWIARKAVRAYQLTLSPLIGFHCRHLPTCSSYADEALARHGLWAGGWMTLARLCRCHPFGTAGLDFVPAKPAAQARWFLPWRYGRWRRPLDQPPAP